MVMEGCDLTGEGDAVVHVRGAGTKPRIFGCSIHDGVRHNLHPFQDLG